MNPEVKFLAYCIEIYKADKQISGRQAYERFRHYGVLDYIIDCYGALHTTGAEYTIDSIDKFIESHVS